MLKQSTYLVVGIIAVALFMACSNDKPSGGSTAVEAMAVPINDGVIEGVIEGSEAPSNKKTTERGVTNRQLPGLISQTVSNAMSNQHKMVYCDTTDTKNMFIGKNRGHLTWERTY